MAKRKTRDTMKNKNEGSQFLESRLGLDPYSASLSEVANAIRGLEERQKDGLISTCEAVLNDPLKRSREEVRVAAVKVLIALLPRTLKHISSWLQNNAELSMYEAHFSFFCFLDQVPRLPGGKDFAPLVPKLIQDYLNRVKAETAQAAWMAGDLLGDHWESEAAFSVLSQAAKRANFAAGRLGAIHGLSHLLVRVGASKRILVVRLLRQVSRSDKSRKVRNFAKHVLERADEEQSL